MSSQQFYNPKTNLNHGSIEENAVSAAAKYQEIRTRIQNRIFDNHGI